MEERGVVIDTMVWAHALNRDSPYFGKARKLISEHERSTVLLPNIALELYNVLVRDYGLPAYRASSLVLKLLERYPVIPITKAECAKAIEIASSQGLLVFDALVAAAALVNGFHLVTFDKRLANTYRRLTGSKR